MKKKPTKPTTALAVIPKPLATKPPKEKRRPRTAQLFPEPAFDDIRDAALAYFDVREQRQALTPKEVEKKEKLLVLMKKHKLRTYHDTEARILVEVVVTDETVKVHRDKSSDEEEND